MGRISELVSAEFAAWEQRGRGWQVWPEPVRPEPAFVEFPGYQLPQAQLPVDDGIRPTFLASLFDSIHAKLNPKPLVEPEEIIEPEPVASEAALTQELLLSLPASLDISEEVMGALMDSLHDRAEPTGFEILGTGEGITLQFAASPGDAPAVQRQLGAFLPKLTFSPAQKTFASAWNSNDGEGFIVDFGLAYEFMLPLETSQPVDPYVGLVAVLNELRSHEVAVFQVLFQPVRKVWPSSVWRSITDPNGKALFVNRPELIPGTKEKLEKPLFGVVVRAAAKAENFDRAVDIVREMASALRTFRRAESNRLIPLSNEEYPFEVHEEDLISRQSRRGGMLLNRDELLGFVHLPSDEVRAPRLRRERTRTKAAPATAMSPSGILLGKNRHAGKTTPVHLTADQRVKHTHIIGASGSGKSTLLFNLIQQDIANGQGLAVLDPHGDLIERILGVIPPNRIDDVILIDPTDEEYSIGFNILSAHSDFEKNLLASDLVSIFRRLSSSWGDQLNSVLNNAIRAFLESSRGGTLSDLRRFLIDAQFRNEFLETVRDPDVVFYWRKAFPQLGGNKSIGPVLTRLDAFLGPKPIRYMVSQTANNLDFAHILDTGKIFLAKLPKGVMGDENSFLLGSLLVSKFQQLVMSRQRLSVAQRREFWFYIDEFQDLITPSLAEILTGGRKYRIGLVLAHHNLQQLQRDADVASAVMSNPCTRVVFRVGDADAQTLAKGFASFEASDLQNLEKGEAIGRIERSDADFNLSIPLPVEIDPAQARATRESVTHASRKKYATPRAEVEAAALRQPFEETVEAPKTASRPVRKPAEQKAAEVPKPTGSEKEVLPADASVETKTISIQAEAVPLATPEPQLATPIQPPPIPDEKGIGGHQHNLIRERIESVARTLGFYPEREKRLPNGQKIDVALERANQTIACEIAMMTTIDHEVGNVDKCLKAGCQHVAVICPQETRLAKIQKTVTGCMPSDELKRVGYYTPDQFIAYLESLKLVEPSIAPTEDTRLGKYKIKRRTSKLTPDETKAQESSALKMIAEAMRRKT